LILGHFLECYRRGVVALDIGTFIGASAFLLASHPKVAKVISVDPNPTIFDELADKSNIPLSARFSENVDLDQLRDLRTLDVARATFAEFSSEREKVEFREGAVGHPQAMVKEGSFKGVKKVDTPFVDPQEGTRLVAFVDGLHTKEGVRADLSAIFDQNPHAVALLDDCRRRWGPFVQAGVVDFLEQAQGEYSFELLCDLGPGLTPSGLGIVYPGSAATETRRALNKLIRMFSQRLDLLRLPGREDDLVGAMIEKIQELQKADHEYKRAKRKLREIRQKLQQANEKLRESRESKARLESRVSSRRYKIADAVAERALRIPGLRHFLR
jgi:hypothetical protein